jgi:hypothetical protein
LLVSSEEAVGQIGAVAMGAFSPGSRNLDGGVEMDREPVQQKIRHGHFSGYNCGWSPIRLGRTAARPPNAHLTESPWA